MLQIIYYQLFMKQILGSCYMSGTVLGTGDALLTNIIQSLLNKNMKYNRCSTRNSPEKVKKYRRETDKE